MFAEIHAEKPSGHAMAVALQQFIAVICAFQ